MSDNFVVINFNFDEEALAYLNANCTNDYANESLCVEENVYNLIKENPNITIQEIADAVSKSKRTINNIINSLKEKGMLERIGKTKGYWNIK
ncbi:MAG: winged helix-turn-helix domain-containing protein [Bacilli bacterium]|nr:winged helix-turn-helix domain-containing protein [Bacilli bacterium]